MRNRIIAVIPCYNVDKFCENVVREVLPLVSHIIAIDDGSIDATGKILSKIAKQHSQKMKVIPFPQNQGKGFALLEGIQYALKHFDFDTLVTFDGDGQHSAPFLTSLAQSIESGADMAIGARTFKKMPPRNRFGNFITALLIHLAYPKAPHDTQSGMRAFSKDFASEIVNRIPGGHYEMEFKCLLLALRQKRKIEEIPIPTIYIDKNRSSHFRRWKDSIMVLKTLFMHLLGQA